jgi:hypothetical protein
MVSARIVLWDEFDHEYALRLRQGSVGSVPPMKLAPERKVDLRKSFSHLHMPLSASRGLGGTS